MAQRKGWTTLILLVVAFPTTVSQTTVPEDDATEDLLISMDIQGNKGFTSRTIKRTYDISCVTYYAKALNGEGGVIKASLQDAETGETITGLNHTDLVTSDNNNLFYFEIERQKKPFKLVLRAEPGPNRQQLTSIQKVQISRRPCQEQQASCNFEKDSCGFFNRMGYSEKWEISSAQVTDEDKKHLPKVDATTGSSTGHYMFVRVKKDGFTGTLESSLVLSNMSCIHFYYAISGRGRLDIGIISNMKKVTSLSNDEGPSASSEPQWVFGQVEIKKELPGYKLLIQAIPPPSKSNDEAAWIAIDDIKVIHHSCSYTEPDVPPVSHAVIEEASCDFESECVKDWTSPSDEDSKEWSLRQAVSMKPRKPRSDHTLQSPKGHYQFVYLPKNKNNNKAILRGPEFDRSLHNGHHNCFSFWYYMSGSNVPQFSVYFRWPGSQSEEPLWMRQGSQQAQWRQAFVYTPDPGRNNKGHIEFEVVSTETGSVVVDDIKVYDGPCPHTTQLCDFEQGTMCGYEASDNAWILGDVPSLEGFTGLKSDHSTGTRSGFYIYAGSTQVDDTKPTYARLMSPLYHPTPGRCLKFFYNVHSNATRTNALEVFMQLADGHTYLLEALSGEANDEHWRFSQINIFTGNYFQIIFEARLGVVSLDDIEFSEFSCADRYGCDFEQGMCAWSTDMDDPDNLDWQVTTGHLLEEDGPEKDVTFNSKFGHFLYLQTSAPAKTGDTAVLMSQILDYGECLTFHYSITELEAGHLSVRLTDFAGDAVPKIIWSASNSQGVNRVWRRAKVDLNTQSIPPSGIKNFRLDHIGTVGTKLGAGIAVDEIKIFNKKCKDVEDDRTQMDCMSLGPDGQTKTIMRYQQCNFIPDCPDGEDETNCGTCDFGTESGWCLYKSVSQGEVGWLQANNVSKQHTLLIPNRPKDSEGINHGNYLLVAHLDIPMSGRMLAELEMAHEIGPTPGSCQLQFYLYMTSFSFFEPTFKVVIRRSAEETVIFRGDRAVRQEFWSKIIVDIGSIDYRFKIAFLGHKDFGKSNEGNIAIDDISLLNCEYPSIEDTCKKSEFRCERGSCVDVQHVCDFTDDCGDQSDEEDSYCDTQPIILRTSFEEGFGDWTQENGQDDPIWVILTGQDGQNMAAHPGRDHTLGTLTGHFIGIDKGQRGHSATLISPVLVQNSDLQGCHLHLYYYLNSPHELTRFSVSLRTSELGEEKLIFKRFSGHGQAWTRADILIEKDDADQPFQIVIRGFGFDNMAFLALDDMSLWGCEMLTNQTLPEGTTPAAPPCPPRQRACTDGTCLPEYRFCDLINHCADGSDEMNCGTCNFEEEACGWHDESQGIFSWALRGSYQQLEPSFDATNQTEGKGHYMLLLTHSAGVNKDSAVLMSPNLPETDPSCQLSFYYYTNIEGSVAHLHVESQRREDLDTQRRDSIPKTGGISAPVDQWTRVTVKLGFAHPGSKVFLRQEFQDFEKDPAIAIDDIKFEHCGSMSDLKSVDKWPDLLSCSFRTGSFCQYTPSYMSSDYHWSHGRVMGPNGQLVEAARAGIWDGSKAGHIAYLTSHWINGTEHPLCLKFAYMTFGVTLTVRQISPHNIYGQTIFSHHSYDNIFKEGYANIPKTDMPFMIQFMAVLGQHSQSVYLYDLKVSGEECPQSSICDFETDDCGFISETQDTWVNIDQFKRDQYLPIVDHTHDSFSGHFMGIIAKQVAQTARLTKKNIEQPPSETSCTYFWYRFNGFEVGTLTVKLKKQGSSTTQELVSVEGAQGYHWRQSRVEIPQDAGRYSLTFEANLKGSTHESMAIDDVETVSGACPQPGTCDFDSSMCGYTTHSVDESKGQETESRWLRLQSRRPISPFGPRTDSKSDGQNGGYAFSDQFVKAFLDDTKLTRMVSPVIPKTVKSCLSFWYYFNGEADGSLRVKIGDSVLFETDTPGEEWKHSGHLEHAADRAYQITFETERRSHAQASMAIDDILITKGTCAKHRVPVVPSLDDDDSQQLKKKPDSSIPASGSASDQDVTLKCDQHCVHWKSCFPISDTIKCVCQDGYGGQRCQTPLSSSQSDQDAADAPQVEDAGGEEEEQEQKAVSHSIKGDGGSNNGWKVPVAVFITILVVGMVATALFVYLVRTNRLRAPARLQRLMPSLLSPSDADGMGNTSISFSKEPESGQGIMNPVYDSGKIDGF